MYSGDSFGNFRLLPVVITRCVTFYPLIGSKANFKIESVKPFGILPSCVFDSKYKSHSTTSSNLSNKSPNTFLQAFLFLVIILTLYQSFKRSFSA